MISKIFYISAEPFSRLRHLFRLGALNDDFQVLYIQAEPFSAFVIISGSEL